MAREENPPAPVETKERAEMATQWQHAIITGAGSGLGHGIALRLLRRGSRVSILDRLLSPDRAAELELAAAQGGGAWQHRNVDVTSLDAMTVAVAGSLGEFGACDLALNCAGIGLAQSFADMPDEAFRRMIEINVFGSYNFARAVLPQLKPGSRFVLFASMAGITSNYGYTAYGTSKFAVLGLATSLRYEYEPLGIRFSVICPPEVKTPMVAEEHRTGDPVALELKQIAGSLQTDEAVDGIVAGLDAGKWMIIPGFKAKATAFFATRTPGITHAVTMFLIRKILRKHGRI
jgi:3-dehydrosphinganine reductase